MSVAPVHEGLSGIGVTTIPNCAINDIPGEVVVTVVAHVATIGLDENTVVVLVRAVVTWCLLKERVRNPSFDKPLLPNQHAGMLREWTRS